MTKKFLSNPCPNVINYTKNAHPHCSWNGELKSIQSEKYFSLISSESRSPCLQSSLAGTTEKMPGAGTLSDNLRAVVVFSEIQLPSPLLLQADHGAFLCLKVSYTHSSVERSQRSVYGWRCWWLTEALKMMLKDEKFHPRPTFLVCSDKSKCETLHWRERCVPLLLFQKHLMLHGK